MKLLTYQDISPNDAIGGKAKNLAKLMDHGIPVPQWAVIPAEVMQDGHLNAIESLVEKLFHDAQNLTYAVRSSALDEDGSEHSFAGQYESYLHVGFDQIAEKVKAIRKSTQSDRVLAYKKQHNLILDSGIAVIIQKMIEPDVSGVAFGADPVSGNTDTKIVNALYGLGEALVSGDLDADTFTIKDGEISSRVVDKNRALRKATDGHGTKTVEVQAVNASEPSLTNNQIKAVCVILEKLETALGSPQDIEFAFHQHQLSLLQTRPITTLKKQGEYILWDNSNIIESYPGITTPLTFSFIIKMYERVYRQFVGLLGVNQREIENHKEVFANTLGLVRGRVYYNLLSWYKMLAMVPGYSINAQFMENMMGVKERFELKEDYKMSKGRAWWRIIVTIFKALRLLTGLPKERDRFYQQVDKTIMNYKAMDFNTMEVKEIVKRYKSFETELLLQWNAPLINDFFAMIFFGLLQKQTKKYRPEEPNIHNDLLCGSKDIISVEPIHRTLAITQMIQENEEWLALFKQSSAQDIWTKLNVGPCTEVKKAIDAYIAKFGERCVGELKLESISYAQDPVRFIKMIKSYVEQDFQSSGLNTALEEELRQTAEHKMEAALRGKFLKKRLFNYILKRARQLISNRENLRYERTRGFGMVRTMFAALGNRLAADGLLHDSRDVFYLELDEIKALDTAPWSSDLKANIEERKAEFENYKNQDPPQERFSTYGMNFTDEYIYSTEKLGDAETDLEGIGCCPGIVKAKVQVIRDPSEIESLNGDILVTSSTDPGWVILFPSASGILVERGSLLSHSAIVSREMGKPCIVSITGLLRSLKTGDEVIMDGSTGKISIVK